jgi:hypothetical protein
MVSEANWASLNSAGAGGHLPFKLRRSGGEAKTSPAESFKVQTN